MGTGIIWQYSQGQEKFKTEMTFAHEKGNRRQKGSSWVWCVQSAMIDVDDAYCLLVGVMLAKEN